MARILDASQEGRIALAINALKNGQIKSIRSAACNFDVPRNTLNARFHGRVQKGTTYTKSFKLTQFEEESLVQWIISMGKRGMPPRPSQVHSMANSLISKRGEPTPPSLIGKNWIQRFLSRHAELTTKYIRKYSYQRAKCEDSKLIQQWFNQFLEIKAQYGILDEDIYNFDETGFAMGTIATTKVVTASDCFGQYRMLVLDGHGSHVAPEFDLFYFAHKIIPICMPPHSSHLLQPLDVTCFSVLKRMYGAQIENKMRGRIQHIDKEDFLELYPIVRQQTFKSTTIQNGFAATGLVPYDPERVLAKLHVQVDKTPTPPGSSHSSNSRAQWVPETPHNPIQLQLQSQTIQRLLREQNSPPTPTKTALKQLVKGCELAMHNAVFLAKEIEELKAVNASMQRKLRRSRKQLVYTGSLTRQEAQELAQSSATVQNVIQVTNSSWG
ncbi:hypothetical protein B7463_g11274, partial [Scytalidium lignicola]